MTRGQFMSLHTPCLAFRAAWGDWSAPTPTRGAPEFCGFVVLHYKFLKAKISLTWFVQESSLENQDCITGPISWAKGRAEVPLPSLPTQDRSPSYSCFSLNFSSSPPTSPPETPPHRLLRLLSPHQFPAPPPPSLVLALMAKS